MSDRGELFQRADSGPMGEDTLNFGLAETGESEVFYDSQVANLVWKS